MGEQQQQQDAELYAIVEEHQIVLAVDASNQDKIVCRCTNQHSVRPKFTSYTCVWIDGKKWTFTVSNKRHVSMGSVLSLELVGAQTTVTTEVIFWQLLGQKMLIFKKAVKEFCETDNKITCYGSTSSGDVGSSDGCFNVLIRMLVKREQNNKFNPFSPLNDVAGDAVILKVDNEQFTVSKTHLMSVSPVFNRMLNSDMREKASGVVIIEETDANEFRAFLEAISPGPIVPNPTHLNGLIKMSSRYDVKVLHEALESMLINHVDLSLLDRLLLAEEHHMKHLKEHILSSMSVDGLRQFYKENRAVLANELLLEIIDRTYAS